MSKRQQNKARKQDLRERQGHYGKRANRKLRYQRKKAAIRAKYGPSRKPAPVTVIRPGQDEQVVDQDIFARSQVADSIEGRARAAGYQSYRAYLNSPWWKRRRREALERDGWRCVKCRRKKHLQVHHRWYVELGSEPLKSLETLCQPCHQHLHGRH